MLVMILVLFLIFISLGGGGWGYSRYGWVGMSPAGLILLVVAIMYFSGHLGAR
jgi:hypothetical protein